MAPANSGFSGFDFFVKCLFSAARCALMVSAPGAFGYCQLFLPLLVYLGYDSACARAWDMFTMVCCS